MSDIKKEWCPFCLEEHEPCSGNARYYKLESESRIETLNTYIEANRKNLAEITRLQSIIKEMQQVDDVFTSTMQLNEQDAFEQYMKVTGWSPDADSENAFRYAYKHGFKYAPCIEVDDVLAGQKCGNNHPIIELGYGKIEVAEGYQDDKLALIFGKNGSGILGEDLIPNRVMEEGEAIAVVTFANVECLEIVQDKISILRNKLEAMTK